MASCANFPECGVAPAVLAILAWAGLLCGCLGVAGYILVVIGYAVVRAYLLVYSMILAAMRWLFFAASDWCLGTRGGNSREENPGESMIESDDDLPEDTVIRMETLLG